MNNTRRLDSSRSQVALPPPAGNSERLETFCFKLFISTGWDAIWKALNVPSVPYVQVSCEPITSEMRSLHRARGRLWCFTASACAVWGLLLKVPFILGWVWNMFSNTPQWRNLNLNSCFFFLIIAQLCFPDQHYCLKPWQEDNYMLGINSEDVVHACRLPRMEEWIILFFKIWR